MVSWGPNRLDVFVAGTDTRSTTSGGTAPLGVLPHWVPTSWVVSVWCRPNRSRGGPTGWMCSLLAPIGALYHKWWDGANWGPSLTDYEYQGGICTTPPEVVAWGPNRLDVFVLGTDHALYHKAWDGANWYPSVLVDWEYLGGTCASAPKVVAWGPNRLDIFVLGMDLALYHKWWDGANWGAVADGVGIHGRHLCE